MKKRYCLFILFFFVSACSGGFSTDAEKSAVKVFHQDFNRHDINAIMAMSTEAFKKSDSESNIARYFNAVYKKLGKNINSKLINWRVFNGTTGKQVSLEYQSKFKNGKATETFVFRENNGKALLQHYNIQSNVFILGS